MTSGDGAGAVTTREIESQPEVWARALTDPSLPIDRLPAEDGPVLVIGCGTSYYIGEAWGHLRTAAGLGRTRASVPSQLSWIDPEETIVLLSRSGTTSDVEQIGRRLRDDHRVVGIVGTPGTPIDEVCHSRILLDFADEESVMQTRFATTSLAVLRRAIGEDTSHLVADARRALASELPVDGHAHLVFLGTGWSEGLAHEAALKCLEASGVWAEAYAVREYQHGPISAADSGTLVWSFAPVEEELSQAIGRTGATLHVGILDPMAEVVRAQRVAVALGRRAGRDPDRPAHLSRSVTDG
jgi:fructoselysine-6-P-deglycase FrlB-like protein